MSASSDKGGFRAVECGISATGRESSDKGWESSDKERK